MTDEHATVGGRIRATRTAGGWTQSQLSERCGIPKPTISRYENDHVLPSLITLNKLAIALNVAVPVLVIGAERPVDHLYAALRREGVDIRSAAEAHHIASLVAQLVAQERSETA